MKKSKTSKPASPKQSADQTQGVDFLVVGIGASAGGINALKQFFASVSDDSGIAYIVILHLSPDHDSQLAAILQTGAAIPVTQVTEQVHIEPNHVYVVPPNKSLKMVGGFIVISNIETIEERRAPVDIFFRTLGESKKERAVAVILSGTGADGSMGVRRVKECGGVIFVQNPNEAEYNDMPRNSIATGLVDGILSAAAIPLKILAYQANLGKIQISLEPHENADGDEQALREIFTQLRVKTGHDFTNYKRATILRRIERRINVRELDGLKAYARYIREQPAETEALLRDLLISVTNFFRDRNAFDALEKEVIPRILESKTAADALRVWVAGCATGEEAYSLAMLLAEQTFDVLNAPKIQIFATDIDENAVAFAREGFYTLNDAADVSPERLHRFFKNEGDGFKVRRELREMILFASHNLIKDAPFSHLDLVTCRNLLIYLNRTAQSRVMEIAHFALQPNGYLFLGSSESIDGASDLFAPVSKENNMFQSRPVNSRVTLPVPDLSPVLQFNQRRMETERREESKRDSGRLSFADLHQQILEQYAPPSVIVNKDYDVLHLSEHAGRFLQIAGGEPTFNLLKVVRKELRLELRTALYQAVERRTNVEAKNLRVKIDETFEHVNLHVRPILREGDAAQGFILVLFEPATETVEENRETLGAVESLAHQLEEALIRTKAQLRFTGEQYEMQTEEFKASNKELQAISEELRSAAEELTTGKEELLSVNEELTTVNEELKVKMEEISQSNNDFQNLINSTDIGTIFLDRSLRLNLFSPAVRDIFNLITSEEGRELSDITNRLKNYDITADAKSVLETLQTIEREVRTVEDRVYLLTIVPYRAGKDRINGLVITFVNITARKQAEEALIESAARLERQSRIFETTLSSISDFAYTFDKDGRFVYSNRPMLDLLGITLEEIIGKNFFDLDYPHDLAARMQNQIQRVFDYRETVKDETPFINLRGEKGFYEYIFSPVKASDGSVELVAGSTRDVTERKSRETILVLLAEISHDLARLTDIGAIMRSVGAKIGDFLELSNCTFMEINESAGEAVANHEWHRADAPDLSGVYRIGEFVTGEFQRACRAGETFVVNDTQIDSRTDAKGYAAIKVGAFVSVPLIRNDRWLFLLVVFDSKPRDWKAEEIELIRELTTRIWMRLERANTEKALRESEERFRALIDKGVDVITICDRDGNIKYASPSIEAMTGYTVGEFVSHNPFGNTIHPDDEARCQAALQEINENPGKSVFLQHRYLHKSGGWRWLEGTFTGFFHIPAINGLVANFRDTTERKEIEENLRQSEERLRLVNESVEDFAIFTMDENGSIDSWNTGAERIFGYREQEIIGRDVTLLFTPEDRRAGVPAREIETAAEKGRAEDERWHLCRDGSRFYASGVMAKLQGTNGFVKIARDMTAKVNAEQSESERKTLKRLVGALETERQRLARDLHDHLGQQLTALRLKLEAIRKSCTDEEMGGIIDESQKIARQIDSDVSFIAWELRPAALDDLGLIAALINYVQEWSHHSGVTAEFHTNGLSKTRLLPETETNLYRIVQETLNNIYKHANASRVTVMLRKVEDEVVLIVEDDGDGFEVEEKIENGSGLGLPGIRERAALIGGNSEIESGKGTGTAVFIRAPVAGSGL